ncbi:MAG: hypothetical protein H6Q18_658 [Bacteroidetes bacterium]|nr:hypothetical protein [Bacteroidota bacterium]
MNFQYHNFNIILNIFNHNLTKSQFFAASWVKLLVGLYWDGKSSIPLDFAMFSEKGKREDKPYGMTKKDLSRQYNKKRMKDAEGVKRIKELDKSKIEIMLQLFYMAVFHSLVIDYVLCDSWFTCQSLIVAVRSQNVHLIGMYKFVTTKFKYQGKC